MLVKVSLSSFLSESAEVAHQAHFVAYNGLNVLEAAVMAVFISKGWWRLGEYNKTFRVYSNKHMALLLNIQEGHARTLWTFLP